MHRMGESGRETLETKRRGGGYLFQVGAETRTILRSRTLRGPLSPPPFRPPEERRMPSSTTWHYAAVNVQITPHLLHSKQRSFNDTRTGGTVVNFSPADHLARSLVLSLSLSLHLSISLLSRPREETVEKCCRFSNG